MGKTVKKFAIGTLFAAVVGYIAGILTAPKSGKETRDDIMDAAVKSKAEAEKQLKRLHTEMTTMLSQAKERSEDLKGKAREDIDEAMKMVQAVKEKARDMLSAVHEGD